MGSVPLEQTSWRGLRIDHPPEWEIVFASGQGRPLRCTFADRHFQRLDVRWQAVKAAVNMDKVVEKYRTALPEGKDAVELAAPSPWRGLIRKTQQGAIIHAARHFTKPSVLVEATLVWPDSRDTGLERAILSAVDVEDPQAELRLWQAMGLSLTIGRGFDLRRNLSKVGRVTWEFAAEGGGPAVTVERYALPRFWLKDPLPDWLRTLTPSGHRELRRGERDFASHRAAEYLSRGRARRKFGVLLGLREIRLDLAWECPAEQRLYHVSVVEDRRENDISVPKSLAVRCCPPAEGGKRPARAGKRPASVVSRSAGKAAEFLRAVPHIGRNVEIRRRPDGNISISMPMKKPSMLLAPISRLAPYSKQRRMDLDGLGTAVLDLCDGKRTAEEIIEQFAADHQLTFREAHLSVSAYMGQLSHRGIVMLAKERGEKK